MIFSQLFQVFYFILFIITVFCFKVIPYLTGTSLDATSSKTPWKRNASGQLIQEALKHKQNLFSVQICRLQSIIKTYLDRIRSVAREFLATIAGELL